MTDAKNDYTEHQVSSTTVYQGALLKVKEDRITLPNGQPAKREYVEHQGAVMIIPLLDEHTIVLERQYRYPVREHCYELPAGKREIGEAPLLTAQRELKEETGYEAKHWQSLGSLLPCVGYSDERIEFFLARELSFTGAALDEGEFLDVLVVTFEQAIGWISSGKINDLKTIAGIFWAKHLIGS
jgi:ADP-ribose pyrophosphatase